MQVSLHCWEHNCSGEASWGDDGRGQVLEEFCLFTYAFCHLRMIVTQTLARAGVWKLLTDPAGGGPGQGRKGCKRGDAARRGNVQGPHC